MHSYIDVLAKIVGSYGATPHAIRQQHMDMSIEYLRAIREEKVRTEETLEAVIQKLAGCINEERVFALNAKAFTLRSGNMSRKRIEEIYRRVEIGTLLRRVDATTVNREYEGNEGVNEHKSDELVRGLYAEIDEIVEVRNLVAHGALQIDNIEDNELVRQKIEKMRVFGRALYEVLEQEVWRASLGAGRMRELGEPIAKYGTSIACFDLGTGTVRSGEWIVLERNDATQPFRSGVIQSLQVNREDKEEVNGGEGVQVGVGLSMRASSRGKYWIPEEEIVELVSQ